MYLLILISILFTQEITYKDTNVQLSKLTEFNNSDELPFYQRTFTLYTDGYYYIVDNGNSVLYKINQERKVTQKINFNGSGPGEFNRGINNFFIIDNKLVLSNLEKFAIYNFDLKLEKDVSLFRSGLGTCYEYFDKIMVNHGKKNKHLYSFFNSSGDLINQIINENYDGKRKGFAGSKNKYQTYKNTVYQIEEGEYKIQKYNSNMQPTDILTRKFKRIKNLTYEQDLKRFENMFGPVEDLNKGNKNFAGNIPKPYHSDIYRVIGIFKNYLFITINSNKEDKLDIDIINLDKITYTTRTIDYKEGDIIMDMNICENQMTIDYYNRENGPYIIVYNISMN